MNSFDDFTTTAQNLFDNACKATGEFVNTSKLRIERMNLKSDLERAYAKLGKLHYSSAKNGQTEDDVQAESNVIARIDALLKRISELTDQINEQD